MYFSFHQLFSIRVVSGENRFLTLLKSEYPNFIVPSLPAGISDLEIFFEPFDENKLGVRFHPFFNYCYGDDAVFESSRYKTARWKVALVGLQKETTKIYFWGNKSSELFFVGEILEPLLRFKLAQKGCVLMHSSSVALSEKGILISGIRHTGKTLIMLESVLLGASLLSDDSTFVTAEKRLWAYPKKVNFFTTHFRELPSLKPYWDRLPLKDRFRMKVFQGIRHLTRDYAVLGHQRFLPEVISHVQFKNSANLKRLVILTRETGTPFTIRRQLSLPEVAAKMVANNQWEALAFQKMLIAYAYGNQMTNSAAWQEKEAELIRNFCKDVENIELVIPDFSPRTLSHYLQAVRDEVLK